MPRQVVARLEVAGEQIPVLTPRTREDLDEVIASARGERVAVVLPDAGRWSLPLLTTSKVVALFVSAPSAERVAVAEQLIEDGSPYADPELASPLLELARRQTRSQAPADALSDRERAVMELVDQDLSNRAIAARLFISEHTVRNHLQRIYRKLGVARRQEAVRLLRHPVGEDGDRAGAVSDYS